MCGSKPPDPPNMRPMAEATLEQARIWENIAKEQLDWAKSQGTWAQGILEDVLGIQMPMMEMAYENAKRDRERYESVYQPIEDDLVRDFQTYDTPAQRERKAAEMAADVRASFDAQRKNALDRLEGYGVDPGDLRNMALDRELRGQEAAMTALQSNRGRDYVENMGRALRGEAINIGRGMPSQVAQSQGIVNQTAGGATSNMNSTLGTQSNLLTAPSTYGGLGMQGRGMAADIYGMDYQNRLGAHQAQQASSAAGWGGAMELAGAVAVPSIYRWGGEDGGVVPEGLSASPGPTDKHPVMLADDEYVVPADVVRKKGTEFFDKLLEKYEDGGQYDQKRQGLEVSNG